MPNLRCLNCVFVDPIKEVMGGMGGGGGMWEDGDLYVLLSI